MMRDSPGYRWFLKIMVPVVVGRLKWRSLCASEPLSKFVTATDEAFGLVVLDKSWETWYHVAIDRIGPRPVKKYTRGGRNNGGCKRYG